MRNHSLPKPCNMDGLLLKKGGIANKSATKTPFMPPCASSFCLLGDWATDDLCSIGREPHNVLIGAKRRERSIAFAIFDRGFPIHHEADERPLESPLHLWKSRRVRWIIKRVHEVLSVNPWGNGKLIWKFRSAKKL